MTDVPPSWVGYCNRRGLPESSARDHQRMSEYAETDTRPASRRHGYGIKDEGNPVDSITAKRGRSRPTDTDDVVPSHEGAIVISDDVWRQLIGLDYFIAVVDRTRRRVVESLDAVRLRGIGRIHGNYHPTVATRTLPEVALLARPDEKLMAGPALRAFE